MQRNWLRGVAVLDALIVITREPFRDAFAGEFVTMRRRYFDVGQRGNSRELEAAADQVHVWLQRASQPIMSRAEVPFRPTRPRSKRPTVPI